MFVWDMRDQERRELDEMHRILFLIEWHIEHPPEIFKNPALGTDVLRLRPRVDLSRMVDIGRLALKDLETLRAVHEVGPPEPDWRR